MRQLIRLSLPALLLGAGLWLLSGCLPIPTFQATVEGQNAERKVGDANSRKPIRVSRATRADVLRVLGTPSGESEDGRAVAYRWKVLHGVTVWPLCFYAQGVHGARMLVLRFDEHGVLQSTEAFKRDEQVIQWTQGPAFLELPQGMRPVPTGGAGAARPATVPSPDANPNPQPR